MLRGGSVFRLRFLLRHDQWSVREHANTRVARTLPSTLLRAGSVRESWLRKQRRELAKKQVVFSVKPPQFLGHLHGHAHDVPKQGINRFDPEHLVPEDAAKVA
jgi:hypothetical protein